MCFLPEAARVGTSMPEPDAMVVRGNLTQYRNRRMRAEEIGLVVEVSDASLPRDQVFKKTIYAQAGIPVYWLVNLIDGRLEEYTDPAGSDETADYRQRRDYSPSDEIPLVLDGRPVASIAVRELLPSTRAPSTRQWHSRNPRRSTSSHSSPARSAFRPFRPAFRPTAAGTSPLGASYPRQRRTRWTAYRRNFRATAALPEIFSHRSKASPNSR